MMRVELHPEAEREMLLALDWYSDRSEFAALAFLREIEQAQEAIASAPLRWPEVHGVRRFLLDHFPYALIYEVRDNHVVVWAVAHQKRRPDYWKSRDPE